VGWPIAQGLSIPLQESGACQRSPALRRLPAPSFDRAQALAQARTPETFSVAHLVLGSCLRSRAQQRSEPVPTEVADHCPAEESCAATQGLSFPRPPIAPPIRFRSPRPDPSAERQAESPNPTMAPDRLVLGTRLKGDRAPT